MAFVEIPEPEFEERGTFVKMSTTFGKIGDRFLGIFKKSEVSEFPDGKPCLNVTFQTDQGLACLSLTGSLRKQFENANLRGGELVALQFAKTVPSGKENPRKVFKFLCDSAWGTKPPPKNGPNFVIPKREMPPEPPPLGDEDIPF